MKINSELFTGAVEVGKAYQVEFIAPKTYEEKTQYYIVPKGGGGGATIYRLLVNNDFTLALNSTNNVDVDLVNDQNVVITSAVTVEQRKFDSADFYAGEILYAIDYSGGGYLLDPFLAGIGGASA